MEDAVVTVDMVVLICVGLMRGRVVSSQDELCLLLKNKNYEVMAG